MRLIVLKNHVPINDVVVETPDTNERYEIYVGRSEDCHVLIDDPLISRHHFVLRNDNGKWFCEKLTTLGIVSIHGQTKTKMEIQEGNEIKCGIYTLIVSDIQFKTTEPVLVSATNAFPEVNVVNESPAKEMPIDDFSALQPLEEKTKVISTPVAEELPSLDIQPTAEDEANNFGLERSETFNVEEQAETNLISNDDFNGNDDLVTFEESSESNDEKTGFFKTFVNYQLVIFGEHAPYDRYQIESAEIFIGRNAGKCQIVLDDPEVSTVHAVIRKHGADITLEDLNSSNGTILNGERINKSQLVSGDEFVIGSTSFTLETRSDLLEAESDRLMPVETGQIIEKEEIQEEVVNIGEDGVDFNSDAPPEKSILKRIWKDPAKRKKLIYAVVGLTIIYLLFGDDELPQVDTAQKAPETKVAPETKPKLQLSKELEQKRNMSYELGVGFFEQNKYFEALKEFQTVMEIDPDYKKVQTYFEQTKVGLKRLEELEAQKRAEEERLKNKKAVEELLVKAREAVNQKSIAVAENYFAQITEKDPENIEVQQLKMELEAWQKEQERIALEKAMKEAARKAMVDALSPGKTFYLKKEWYKSILKLEEFLRRKNTDEDLIKEATEMLSDAKNQLASDLGPLVGKARSLKEGQDLKSAYEAYLDILKIEPTHAEALNEVDDIRVQLETRSKRLYREAIIAESLSLFSDAKEKFQEVQQTSPSDSEYYRKATDKLKNYLE